MQVSKKKVGERNFPTILGYLVYIGVRYYAHTYRKIIAAKIKVRVRANAFVLLLGLLLSLFLTLGRYLLLLGYLLLLYLFFILLLLMNGLEFF